MSLGQVQKVLVCQSSQATDNLGLCPSGQSLVAIDAYVLAPSSQDELDHPIDYSLMGQYFGFGFCSIIVFWGLGKSIGLILRVIR
jgi:hypothetical protein